MEAISNIFENILAKLNIIKFLQLGCVIKLSVGVNTPIIMRIITNALKTVSRLKTRHSSLTHTAATCGTWILPVFCPAWALFSGADGKQKWEISIKKSRV